jgi:hypothetical protein
MVTGVMIMSIDGDEVRYICRMDGRFYDAEEENNFQELRRSDFKELKSIPLNSVHIEKSNDDTPDCRAISHTEMATLIHKNQNMSLSEKG